MGSVELHTVLHPPACGRFGRVVLLETRGRRGFFALHRARQQYRTPCSLGALYRLWDKPLRAPQPPGVLQLIGCASHFSGLAAEDFE